MSLVLLFLQNRKLFCRTLYISSENAISRHGVYVGTERPLLYRATYEAPDPMIWEAHKNSRRCPRIGKHRSLEKNLENEK